MSARQLSVVELGTDLFEQAQRSESWPCEFVATGEAGVALSGDWLHDTVDLDRDSDNKLRAIVELPVGEHSYKLKRGDDTLGEGKIDVKELDRSINRSSGKVFGGAELRNLAHQSGSKSLARQLDDGRTEFTYSDVTYAKRVWVVGEFLDEPLLLDKVNGEFRGTTEVPPGKHEFRFRVDIGEAVTAEAGPQSRLGWHAGTSTGRYLSTNLQEFTATGDRKKGGAESKPKQQVKPTSMAGLANAARAVMRSKEVTQPGSTDRSASPSVDEVQDALRRARERSEKNGGSENTQSSGSDAGDTEGEKGARDTRRGQITPDSGTTRGNQESEITTQGDKTSGGRRENSGLVAALVALPVIAAGVAVYLMRSRNRGEDETEDVTPEQETAQAIASFVQSKEQDIEQQLEEVDRRNRAASQREGNSYAHFRLSHGF
mmetsp:Transcript_2809/g.8565  ORF Transcript_2809/g.8565 Transcript_2809/m.8565 type:complete len:431 (-) Transcript_2809:1748-3040(-)